MLTDLKQIIRKLKDEQLYHANIFDILKNVIKKKYSEKYLIGFITEIPLNDSLNMETIYGITLVNGELFILVKCMSGYYLSNIHYLNKKGKILIKYIWRLITVLYYAEGDYLFSFHNLQAIVYKDILLDFEKHCQVNRILIDQLFNNDTQQINFF